ncbi:unnamed protein product [Trichobilharzia szidati]|nr:unnamed protein product [Trichobilharzia szidati]
MHSVIQNRDASQEKNSTTRRPNGYMGTIYESGNYSELCEKGLDFHNLHSSAEAEDIQANKMHISELSKNNGTSLLITNQKSKEDDHSNTLMKFDSNNKEKKTDSKIPLNEESLNRNHLIASSDSASQQRGKEVSYAETEMKGNNSNNRTNSEYDHSNEEKARLLDGEKSKVTKGEEKVTSENRVVRWRHYCMLARLGGGFCGTFCVVFMFILAVSVYVGWDIWLARWCRQMDNFVLNGSENYQNNVTVYSLGSFDSRSKYFNFTVLVCLGIALILLSYTRAMAFFAFMVTAARRLHDKMLHSCLHTPIKFFEMNPSGAIVNRFSKDLTTVDDMLPMAMCDAIQCFFLVFIMGVVINYMSYWFLIPTIMAIILFYLTQKRYLLISRDLKRLESAAKGPIISWVNVTLQGLPCIRATSSQNNHLVKFQEVMDYHTSVFYLMIAATRWLALRLDLLCVFFTVTIIITSLLLSIYTDFPPSVIGLMITYGINFVGLFQWFIRQSAEVHNQMVSVERIVEYIDLPPELNYTSNQVTLPDNWPQSGHIEFQNFSISYDGEQSWALKNINFVIESGFKVGIVGRTGSGKSTLFSCILRLVTGEQGKILIDDVDIKKVKLEELRKHISVVPQDPMMFAGSIRMNLDPRGEHSDARIWNALSSVQLEKTISNMDKGLDTLMDEGGSNFSTGERQLLSLARAILDDNRIVLVDEVTANVDSKTDSLIQETLRKQFSTCTVLTITHRLQTIIENDIIIVLENGEIIETGAPHILLHTKQGEGDVTEIESMDNEELPIIGTGPFAKLVRETGDEESRKLSKMARDAYLKYTQVV